jgi:RNA polymerase sigma-70 factor, ECF subfamily
MNLKHSRLLGWIVLCFPGNRIKTMIAALSFHLMNQPRDPLLALALSAANGESVAFSRFYEQTKHQVFRVLTRVVGPSADVEDLMQDVYVQLIKALKGYRGDALITTFVHRICVNIGLMHLRSKKRKPEDSLEDDSPAFELESHSVSPETHAQMKQAQHLMQQALSKLSEEKAQVFVLHELMGLMPEEISEIAQCPANTVRSRLNRARVDFAEAIAALKGSVS